VYPNPISSTATIQINPKESGEATLDIYDIQGKLIKRLFKDVVNTGVSKTFSFDRGGLSGGVYL
jgi:hypothetical protein